MAFTLCLKGFNLKLAIHKTHVYPDYHTQKKKKPSSSVVTSLNMI